MGIPCDDGLNLKMIHHDPWMMKRSIRWLIAVARTSAAIINLGRISVLHSCLFLSLRFYIVFLLYNYNMVEWFFLPCMIPLGQRNSTSDISQTTPYPTFYSSLDKNIEKIYKKFEYLHSQFSSLPIPSFL